MHLHFVQLLNNQSETEDALYKFTINKTLNVGFGCPIGIVVKTIVFPVYINEVGGFFSSEKGALIWRMSILTWVFQRNSIPNLLRLLLEFGTLNWYLKWLGLVLSFWESKFNLNWIFYLYEIWFWAWRIQILFKLDYLCLWNLNYI